MRKAMFAKIGANHTVRSSIYDAQPCHLTVHSSTTSTAIQEVSSKLPGPGDRGGRAAFAAAPPATAPQRRAAQAPGAGALVVPVVLPCVLGIVTVMRLLGWAPTWLHPARQL